MSDDETKELKENKHLRAFFAAQEDVENTFRKAGLENFMPPDKAPKLVAALQGNPERFETLKKLFNPRVPKEIQDKIENLLKVHSEEEVHERIDALMAMLDKMHGPPRSR